MGLYKMKGSPFWWYSFQHGKKRIQKSTGLTDKRQAREMYYLKRNGFILGKEKGKPQPIRLKDLLKTYLEDYSKTNKASYYTDCVTAKTLNAFFGDRFVAEVTPQLIERYKSRRTRTLRNGKRISGARVNREMALLKAAFNKGIEWDLVNENPVRRVKFFNESDRGRTRYLTPVEKKRLLTACSPFLRGVVMTALKTGMRQGELLSLKWRDVDSRTNRLTLRKTKSGKIRHIPLHQDVETVLKGLPRLSAFVFADEKGSPLPRHGRLRTDFEAALEKSGIRDFRFHDLRHSFASELVMKGVDIKTVSELMGHSTTRMTERYSHLSPSHKSLAINLLPVESEGSEKQAPRPGRVPA